LDYNKRDRKIISYLKEYYRRVASTNLMIKIRLYFTIVIFNRIEDTAKSLFIWERSFAYHNCPQRTYIRCPDTIKFTKSINNDK